MKKLDCYLKLLVRPMVTVIMIATALLSLVLSSGSEKLVSVSKNVSALVLLYRNPARQSADVKHPVLGKCEEIKHRIDKLHSTHKILLSLSEQCAVDEGPGCAIIDELSVPVQSLIDQI